jgi:hypothetical protein
MEDVVAWIHNSDLSGEKALHSEAYVFLQRSRARLYITAIAHKALYLCPIILLPRHSIIALTTFDQDALFSAFTRPNHDRGRGS